jgi:hypothetical protein
LSISGIEAPHFWDLVFRFSIIRGNSYLHPPEIDELIYLDAKACGDVKAAAALKDKSDLVLKQSHFVTLRFLQGAAAVFAVLSSTPQVVKACGSDNNHEPLILQLSTPNITTGACPASPCLLSVVYIINTKP